MIFIFALLFLSPAGLLRVEAESMTRFEVSPAVGFMTVGFDLNVFHDFPSGFSVGVFNTGVFPLMDNVTGLKVNIDLYNTLLGLAGYRLNILNGLLSLGFYGALGAEFAIINEKINNPLYKINRSYSTFDVLFEAGLLNNLELSFSGYLGLALNFYLSVFELRKSLLSLGISMRI